MPAALFNITVEQGATWSRDLRLSTSAGPVDLTGYSGRGQVRRSKSKTSAKLADFTVTVVAPATGGIVRITLPASVTAAITVSGFFDIELYTAGDAEVVRLVKGRVTLDKEVTT